MEQIFLVFFFSTLQLPAYLRPEESGWGEFCCWQLSMINRMLCQYYCLYSWMMPLFFLRNVFCKHMTAGHILIGRISSLRFVFALLSVFVFRPTNRTSMAQGLFFRWVRAQGRSPHTPGISKNASGPVGIPLKKGRLRRQAMNLTPPTGFRTWKTAPLRRTSTKCQPSQNTSDHIRVPNNMSDRGMSQLIDIQRLCKRTCLSTNISSDYFITHCLVLFWFVGWLSVDINSFQPFESVVSVKVVEMFFFVFFYCSCFLGWFLLLIYFCGCPPLRVSSIGGILHLFRCMVCMIGWLIVLFYSVSTHFGSFNVKLGLFDKSGLVWFGFRAHQPL